MHMKAKPSLPKTAGATDKADCTDVYDNAGLKLSAADAIIDALAMLHTTGDVDSLVKGNEAALLLHAGELIHEARDLYSQARELALHGSVAHV
jgi:hypothetical protein